MFAGHSLIPTFIEEFWLAITLFGKSYPHLADLLASTSVYTIHLFGYIVNKYFYIFEKSFFNSLDTSTISESDLGQRYLNSAIASSTVCAST